MRERTHREKCDEEASVDIRVLLEDDFGKILTSFFNIVYILAVFSKSLMFSGICLRIRFCLFSQFCSE